MSKVQRPKKKQGVGREIDRLRDTGESGKREEEKRGRGETRTRRGSEGAWEHGSETRNPKLGTWNLELMSLQDEPITQIKWKRNFLLL